MSLTISLPPESEAKLKQRAAAAGQDVSAYVSQLVTHFAEPPTSLEELSGPIYQRFLESGMTDDELAEELERAKHEMRAEHVYTHPIDPDDSHYVDLAAAAKAKLIVSRDRHLLNLMDDTRTEMLEFRKIFPGLVVLTPDVYARQLKTQISK